MSEKSFFEISEMTELGEQVYQIVEDGNPQGKYIIVDVDEWERFNNARAELAALRARCERAEAELQAAHVYLDESFFNSSDDYENIELSLADRIAGVVQQLYECRTSLANVTSERDALKEAHDMFMAANDVLRVDNVSQAKIILGLKAQLTAYERQKALRQ